MQVPAAYAGKFNFHVPLVDDVFRRGHHNETMGTLVCRTKNDGSVRCSLGRSTSPVAVAAYTYDKLPPAEQKALSDDGHLGCRSYIGPIRQRSSGRSRVKSRGGIPGSSWLMVKQVPCLES
ncbi:PDDEXK nuclease domain-containing protein (plasmid) [Paenarthrobacter ureafaciens]